MLIIVKMCDLKKKNNETMGMKIKLLQINQILALNNHKGFVGR